MTPDEADQQFKAEISRKLDVYYNEFKIWLRAVMPEEQRTSDAFAMIMLLKMAEHTIRINCLGAGIAKAQLDVLDKIVEKSYAMKDNTGKLLN